MRISWVVLARPLPWISEVLLWLSILWHTPSSSSHHGVTELLRRELLTLGWVWVAIFRPDLLLIFVCTTDEVTELGNL